MSKAYLGIDFGTSSVKVLKISENRVAARSRASYEAPAPRGWLQALQKALLYMSYLYIFISF